MASSWKDRLTNEQVETLDKARFRAPSGDIFRNCTIVLMSNAGRSKASIAEALGCATDTVERVRRLYKTLGVLGLTPIKPPGRPSRLSEAIREDVVDAVQSDPRKLGYGFSTWSIARLTEHVRVRCGVRASPSTVRRVLAHEQFSLQRPKHTLKGKRDEKAHGQAQEELHVLKKKRSARTRPNR